MNLVRNPARDGITGCYFDVLAEKPPSPQARDQSLARELWERSLERTER